MISSASSDMRGAPRVTARVPLRRGFTAVEISMVVTVIAILALLILPLFQSQTEEARIAAAENDIRVFATAMQLANAHTGYFYTLSTLDNTDNYDIATVDATLDVPVNTWNDQLTAAERGAIADRWEGPYSSIRHYLTPPELNLLQPNTWFRGSLTGGLPNGDNGPLNLTTDPTIGAVNWQNDHVPLDPWGQPYLFYGPDYYHLPNGVGGAAGQETRYRNALYVSLGPNGLPGDGSAGLSPFTLAREQLQTLMQQPNSDDIYRFF